MNDVNPADCAEFTLVRDIDGTPGFPRHEPSVEAEPGRLDSPCDAGPNFAPVAVAMSYCAAPPGGADCVRLAHVIVRDPPSRRNPVHRVARLAKQASIRMTGNCRSAVLMTAFNQPLRGARPVGGVARPLIVEMSHE